MSEKGMNKFTKNYILTMKDIVREGSSYFTEGY